MVTVVHLLLLTKNSEKLTNSNRLGLHSTCVMEGKVV